MNDLRTVYTLGAVLMACGVLASGCSKNTVEDDLSADGSTKCERSGPPQVLMNNIDVRSVESVSKVRIGIPQGENCPMKPVSNLSVTCGGVRCEHTEPNLENGHVFQVFAHEPGMALLTMSYTDPDTQKNGKIVSELSFADGITSPLVVGAPIPPERLMVFSTKLATPHSCEIINAETAKEWNIVGTVDNVTMFACFKQVVVLPKRSDTTRYLQPNGMSLSSNPHLFVCATSDTTGINYMSVTSVNVAKEHSVLETHGQAPAVNPCAYEES